jgi:hypothetical protein
VRLSLPETPSPPIAATSGIEGVLAVFARYFLDISRMLCQIFHLFTLSEKLGKHLSDLSIFSLLPLQKKTGKCHGFDGKNPGVPWEPVCVGELLLP